MPSLISASPRVSVVFYLFSLCTADVTHKIMKKEQAFEAVHAIFLLALTCLLCGRLKTVMVHSVLSAVWSDLNIELLQGP